MEVTIVIIVAHIGQDHGIIHHHGIMVIVGILHIIIHGDILTTDITVDTMVDITVAIAMGIIMVIEMVIMMAIMEEVDIIIHIPMQIMEIVFMDQELAEAQVMVH
jgi:hypothetical protein